MTDSPLAPTDTIEYEVEIWKKVVDVQMHFNEIEMKIRNFAILLLSALVGIAGLSLKEGLLIAQTHVPIASAILVLCVGVCGIFYFVDYAWYHPLLKGAVAQGQAAEQALKDKLPNVGLAMAIQDSSPYTLLGKTLRSSGKIRVLYGSLAFVFAALAVLVAVVPISSSTTQKSAGLSAAPPASAGQDASVVITTKNGETTVWVREK